MARPYQIAAPSPITLEPIGVVRTPFDEKAAAPRQAVAADAEGTIQLFPGRGFEDALDDLAGWERIWVIFVFDQNSGWKPKVLPPRSDRKRGVFATRSPHRPNPIGLSCVQLIEVAGLVVRVRGVDMLDGSPVLDLKPYVPYADAFPAARAGWLDADTAAGPNGAAAVDPEPGFRVVWSPLAAEQRAWLDARGVGDLGARIDEVLSVSPRPHAYRRIRHEGSGFRLAMKEFRALFRVADRVVTIDRIASGYRPAELTDPSLELHRAFVEAFGEGRSD